MFYGVEAEGPERNILTLFIDNKETTNSAIVLALRNRKKIRRVYFGAGNVRGISEKNIELLSFLLRDGYTIIIEIDDLWQIKKIPDNEKKAVQIVYVVLFNGDKDFSSIKSIKFLDDKTIYWFDLSPCYKNSKNDVFYTCDKKIEKERIMIK